MKKKKKLVSQKPQQFKKYNLIKSKLKPLGLKIPNDFQIQYI